MAQLSGFEYRKKLTVDNTEVGGTTTLTNFPILLSINDSDLATEANSGFVSSSNGFDIAFTSSDGTTQLDHELIDYTATTGELLAWVRFPSLSAISDTDFFIYFGNSSITTDQSSNGTWSSNFTGVYHLDSDYTDATSNSNNCTNNGTTFSTTAQIASSSDFNANTDNINCGTNASLQPTNAVTVSAWVRSKDTNEDQWSAVGGISSNTSWANGYGLFFNSNTTIQFYVGNYTANVATGTIDPDVWNYVVGTYDRFAGGTDEVKIYVNGGAPIGTDNYSTAINYAGGSFTIGGLGGWTTDWLNGYIDEFRVANTSRSADWITTEYNNQSDPAAFFSETEEPPVLANIEISEASATAGGAPKLISDTINLSTPFVDSVESATIQITGNLDSTEDVLAFSNTSLISGSYTSGTGTMALTGRASVADYEAALRAVTYQNTDGSSPDQTTRTISFTVEGLFSYTSNTVTRKVNITTVVSDLTSDFANVVFNFDAQDADGNGDPGTGQPADGALANWIDVTGNITTTAPSPDIPTLDNDFFGERGGILFDYNSGDNGDHYPLSEPTVPPTINSGTFTEKSFAAVFRTTNNLSGLQVVYEQGGGSKGYLIAIKDGTAYAYAFSNVWTVQNKSINLGSVQPNTTYIIVASHESSGSDATSYWRASINGGIIQVLTGANDMGGHGGDPNIGEEDGIRDPVTFANPNTSTSNYDGYIGEVISWNTALTSGQITSIYNFLCDKWCNTAPVISSIEGANIDYLEGDSPTIITSTLSISDSDNTVLDSALVTISSNFESSEDELDFVDTGNITGNWNSTTGELLLTGNALVSEYESAIRSITYENTSVSTPTYSIRQIDILVYDWDDESNTLSRNINVINIPALADIEGSTLAYTEGATIAQYQTALRAITYENTSSDPVELNRTVSFTTNIGSLVSNTEARTISVIAVNSAPILTNLEVTDLTYPQEAINITNTIEVNDPDDTTIDSARVIITGNFKSNEDSLFYSTLFGITGVYDETTGILALSGNASFSDYQTALRSVEYYNYSTIPTGPERVISFLAYDDDEAESDTLKRILEVSAVESISDLKVWLRSDTGIITSGSEVVTWQDQSGNGNDFTGVSGSGTRPTFSATNTELGGESAISFIGNGDSFTDTDGPANYLNGMDEFTLFVVYKSDETSSDQGLWIAENPNGEDKTFTIRYDEIGANGGNNFTNVVKTGILGNDPDNQLESFSDIQSNTSAQITSLHWESGVAYDLYVDGILNNPSYAGPPPIGSITATNAILGKGGKDENNNSWNGLIAEFILYCKNLSEAERQSVEVPLFEKLLRLLEASLSQPMMLIHPLLH